MPLNESELKADILSGQYCGALLASKFNLSRRTVCRRIKALNLQNPRKRGRAGGDMYRKRQYIKPDEALREIVVRVVHENPGIFVQPVSQQPVDVRVHVPEQHPPFSAINAPTVGDHLVRERARLQQEFIQVVAEYNRERVNAGLPSPP